MTNRNMHEDICKLLTDTYVKKNADYGDSFNQSLDKHGLVAGVVRLEDKMNRLANLTESDRPSEVNESLEDTLLDMANYAIMCVMWSRGVNDPVATVYADNQPIGIYRLEESEYKNLGEAFQQGLKDGISSVTYEDCIAAGVKERELHAQNKKPWEKPKRITAKDLMNIEPTSFMDSIRVAITSPVIEAAQKRHEDALRKVNELDLKKEFKFGEESSQLIHNWCGDVTTDEPKDPEMKRRRAMFEFIKKENPLCTYNQHRVLLDKFEREWDEWVKSDGKKIPDSVMFNGMSPQQIREMVGEAVPKSEEKCPKKVEKELGDFMGKGILD